jgi:hypothetical protein
MRETVTVGASDVEFGMKEAMRKLDNGHPMIFPAEAKLLRMTNPFADLVNDLAPGSTVTITIQTPEAKS